MISPLNTRLLIRPDAAKDTTESGIVLTANALNKNYFTGFVLKVGPKVEEVKVESRVAFLKYGYDEIEEGGETLYLVDEKAVIAVYE